ncbi:MAG: NAD(P)/FAD-dependent oxidoreductase [Lachnospiraceae bacterium]
MKKFYDIVVAGGGASGMMAAYQASMTGRNVLLIEKNERLGKKILATGNGRCNLTNLNMGPECYGSESASFAMNVIRKFDEKQLMDFFTKNGLLLHQRNGYVYPNCDQATAVDEFYERILRKDNISMELGCEITSVKKEGKTFEIQTLKGKTQCAKLILAMGSKAYPKTGSDGKGYEIAGKLGHRIITPLPSLTALESDFKHCKEVSGVRADGRITCVCENRIYEERGEIQLTDYGISGIPVFQISRNAVKAVHAGKKVSCHIDFLPDYAKDELFKIIQNKCGNPKNRVQDLFGGLVHSKITNLILKMCGLKGELPGTQIKNSKIQEFVELIKEFPYPITGYRSFDYGQVCQGGVSIREIDDKTMESLLVPGLYIVGELVDVDGICGGYNLQWAFSSGYLAGKAAGQ